MWEEEGEETKDKKEGSPSPSPPPYPPFFPYPFRGDLGDLRGLFTMMAVLDPLRDLL